jgi:single-stranded DNA-binding protein
MPPSINKVFLMGTVSTRCTAIRWNANGTACTTFSLVLTEVAQDGRLFTVQIPCEAWGKGAEKTADLAPGQLVLFEGKVKRVRIGERWEVVVSGFEATPVEVSPPSAQLNLV